MQTDTLADFLTQLRNANMAASPEVLVPYSRLKSDVAHILKREGFLREVETAQVDGKQRLRITLKTGQRNKAIRGIRKVSKPGMRRYVGVQEIPRVLGGLGYAILSTSKGVMTGQDAAKENVGGELLLIIW
ncbi:MAG: 30S ribosomal protein S8 [Bdellovibrionaceae bacterium]|nr:30S ribosomal protein S8 [Pseudobdellovibrionaceae bacterium]